MTTRKYPRDGEEMTCEGLRKRLNLRTLPTMCWFRDGKPVRRRCAVVVWRRPQGRRLRVTHGLWWPVYSKQGRCLGYKYQVDKA